MITAFTIQAENRDLVFSDSGGLQQARMNIFGRITSVAGRRVGIFEDPVITTATPEELTEAKDRKSAYQKAVPLAPGTYKVDVIVRDVSSGATGIKHVGFTVPKYDQAKLSTSTMVLAAKLESLIDQPAVGQFVIGTTKVIPNVCGGLSSRPTVSVCIFRFTTRELIRLLFDRRLMSSTFWLRMARKSVNKPKIGVD